MKQTGFTLIELLIVIAIIAIGLGVLIPMFGIEVPNVMVQNGVICEEGMKFSVSQGYRSQIFGPDGLPMACN
jgi:prepilin-type N-terminal cleavage/methylation domain-containing protein